MTNEIKSRQLGVTLFTLQDCGEGSLLFFGSISQIGTKATGRTGKTISAKVTARVDTGRGSRSSAAGVQPVTLAPPMSSVVVERHQPVTKV